MLTYVICDWSEQTQLHLTFELLNLQSDFLSLISP